MEEVDIILIPCNYCHKLIETYWHKQNAGLFSRPEYVLIADWIYHTECFDKIVEENPPTIAEDYDLNDPF